MPLLHAIATVGGFTLASRVFGFLRDVAIAAVLGAGPAADAFFVAFKLPNFFRRLFAEGAFAAAFVPMFTGHLVEKGRGPALSFASAALSLLLLSLVALVAAVELAAPWVVRALAPGFAGAEEKFRLAVGLLRVTFPYLLFVALAALASGVLNAMGRFAAPAAAPILLNLCLIGAALADVALAGALDLPAAGHFLAWGVALGGLVQFLFLYGACLRAGARLRLKRPSLSPEMRKLLKQLLPGAVGAGAAQANLVIGVVIASLLPTGAISYLYYADRLVQLPLGVIGVAVGTALLPILSRELRENGEAAAASRQNRAVELALLLTLPAAAALIALAQPIVAVLFARGAFGPDSARATAAALAAFALGLPAYVLTKVLSPAFFARGDTATPVKFALVAVAANLGLALVLLRPLAHAGIALAVAVSAWLNAALLARALARGGIFAPDPRLRRRASRILAAALGMAAGLIVLARGLGPWLAGDEGSRIAALALLLATGLGLYGGLAALMGAARWEEVRAALWPVSRPGAGA